MATPSRPRLSRIPAWIGLLFWVATAHAQPQPEVPTDQPADWLDYAATHARRISGMGQELTGSLIDKGETLAIISGFQHQLGLSAQAAHNDKITTLCIRALADEKRDGWIRIFAAQAQARNGQWGAAEQTAAAITSPHEKAMALALTAELTQDPAQFQTLIQLAIDTKRTAIDPAGEHPDPSFTWHEIANALASHNQLSQLQTLIDQDLQDPTARAEALAILSTVQSRLQQEQDARAALGLAYQAHNQATQYAQNHKSYNANPDLALIQIVSAHAALGEYDQARNLAHKAQSPDMIALALIYIAQSVFDTGDTTKASRDLAAAGRLIRTHQDDYHFAWSARQLGRVAATYGQRDTIVRWLEPQTDPLLQASTSLGIAQGLMAPHTPTPPPAIAATAAPASLRPPAQPKPLTPNPPVTTPPQSAAPSVNLLITPHASAFTTPAPSRFDATFHTSAGRFTLRIHRDWAPTAADRFHALATAGFYNNTRFFRVIPGFVAQWGIHGDPVVAAVWRGATFADETATQPNTRGTIAFAASDKPNTRSTQIYVNLADHPHLDTLGFAPFGQVIEGMDILDTLHSHYGEDASAQQREIQLQGNAFLDEHYPRLDHVIDVTISHSSKP